MLGNRSFGFDTGWLLIHTHLYIVEKNLLIMLKHFLSVTKMASAVYEMDNCGGARGVIIGLKLGKFA